MTEMVGSASPELKTAASPPRAQNRSPPTAIKLLLPVWGFKYIRQFLEYSLPTLLASGNIPALARVAPCEFLLMTSTADMPVVSEHPVWRKLANTCNVKVESIDDLITDGNHTTTITLAFARAVRAAGPQMVDTCFVLLNADYLMANNSLANLWKHMNAGASAIFAGNFQIVDNDALPLLRSKADPARLELSLTAREMVSWGLNFLHPSTTANIVNFKLCHNQHTNRLFWRVDENTLIGRFYLMHSICIRPEVTKFEIGSSFDYSFVPEMCPSGNVVVITNSDDYLVLEPAARGHEKAWIRPGPLDPDYMAKTLSEWATARHRKNVQNTIVFHAKDIPSDVSEVVAEADAYVDRVTTSLTSSPQPYRDHPYWIGAIAAHHVATGKSLKADKSRFFVGDEFKPSAGVLALLWRLRVKMFGVPPALGPWHPSWPDFRLPAQALERISAENKSILIVSDNPYLFTRWIASKSANSVCMECERFLGLRKVPLEMLAHKFDACMLFLKETELIKTGEFLKRMRLLLKDQGSIYTVANNDRVWDVDGFDQSFAFHANRFADVKTWVADVTYVRSSQLRWKTQTWMVRLARAARRSPVMYLPVMATVGSFFALVIYACNKAAMRTFSKPPRRGFSSSIFIVMRPSSGVKEAGFCGTQSECGSNIEGRDEATGDVGNLSAWNSIWSDCRVVSKQDDDRR